MDRYSRSIILASVLVLGLVLLALATALVVPFNVTQPGTIRSLTGEAELIRRSGVPSPVGSDRDARVVLSPGQGLRLNPDSTATLTFELDQGFAVVTGPAELKLVESYRRATALGHLLDSSRFSRSYVLTIQQMQGSVRYSFTGTTPRFEDVAITIQLPSSNYVPTTPCWEIAIGTDGTTTAGSVECSP
jgi:hypothetical protein